MRDAARQRFDRPAFLRHHLLEVQGDAGNWKNKQRCDEIFFPTPPHWIGTSRGIPSVLLSMPLLSKSLP